MGAALSLSLDDILKMALQKDASDVHLKAGLVPIIRKHGNLRPISPDAPPLTGTQIEEMAFRLMDPEQKAHFERAKDVDLSYGISGLGRFRVNVLRQRGTVRMVIRNIPDQVKTIDELNLPGAIKQLAEVERGLILVTGATGSGKSSTLAAIIDHINRNKSMHILMIEDPTEYLLRDKKSIITQRELGSDTISFASSLRSALRQDPDVILIGEMRDRETIEIALLAAETGHLVLSTLHTLDAQESINRILAAFEPHQQLQIRMQLASVLKAVISQRLCVRADGQGYLPALEILINNARVAECISKPDMTFHLKDIIEESRTAWGMQSFDQSLMELLRDEKITLDEALKTSTVPENFAIRYSGISHSEGDKWDQHEGANKRVKDQWHDLSTVDLETEIRGRNVKRLQKAPPPVPTDNKKSSGKQQPHGSAGSELLKFIKKFKG